MSPLRTENASSRGLLSQRRLARLNEQIKREISELLRSEVRDPRVGLPTVTAVEVTQDLWLARVYVRPGPTNEEDSHAKMLDGLATAAPFIRRELGRVLKVRRVPELRFLPDRTLEETFRIERILQDVRPERADKAAESETDSTGDEDDVRQESGSQ